jgi:archaellum component FlaC
MQPTDHTSVGTQQPETVAATQTGPAPEGKRTQLKRVREDVQSLSRDVGNFRKNHELSSKKLEKQVSALRSELAAHSVASNIGPFRKSTDANSKRLETQVGQLRKQVADLKSSIAKDAARSRAKEEATLSKILAKVSAKPSTSVKKPAKSTKSKKR